MNAGLAKIRQVPRPSKPDYRIALRPDHTGELDDVVVKDVEMFRMERMDADHIWLCCYLKGSEERITFHLTAKGWIWEQVGERPAGVVYEPGSMRGES